MPPIIEFERVSKKFTIHRGGADTIQERFAGLLRPRARGEDFWALRDVSFGVAKGESLGLVGHNGAGKSTALKLMTRILEPTSGRVAMNGRIAALLELGSGFHPDLSGRENVFLNGSLLGFSRREMQARLPEIVDFAEIGDFIDMEVKHYSSGMYTRLAFAVATAVDPDILITDEVLAVGDESFQRKCMDRIYRFRQLGKTIIFVSHALETVRALCDHAVWLDHGQARVVGSAGEVIDAYLADVNRREQERIAEQLGVDSDGGRRHGTREIEIARVELLGEGQRAQTVFQTHAPLTVRIHYIAHQPIGGPVFGIALHHESGFWINGPNTRFDDIDIPELAGEGYVDYQIAALPLLAGRYQVSVAVVDHTMLHTYDHHDKMYRLVVQSTGLNERYGAIAIPAEWSWRPAMERLEIGDE
ncbi:MAG TPA: ABC transporter ATP-binding protein [Roseiflexaceae bacterium]|nr:ABC transporter ATP-binding protein [Roseiflexaceae bacterium]